MDVLYNRLCKLRLVGQAVKTSPSHGENSGSIPLRAALYFNTAQPRKAHLKRCAFCFSAQLLIILRPAAANVFWAGACRKERSFADLFYRKAQRYGDFFQVHAD